MPFIAPLVGAIAGAIGAVGSFIGGLGIIGQAILGIGLNVAISAVRGALMKEKKQPGGVQFDRQYGADVPRQVACGYVGIAGHDCYVNTYGGDNGNLQQIYAISDYYTDGLSRVAINGRWVELGEVADPEKGFPVVSGGAFRNRIWIKFFDGKQTTTDDYLIDNANPSTRWTADHVGLGMSFILVSMKYNIDNNNSFPDFFFEFRGAPLYDWRKDDTVGGSGSHRWGDPTTYEFTQNPIVIEYNYRRGFTINNDLFCGMNMPASDLPLTKWTAAANICDENVGGSPRYQCCVMVDCMAQHSENITSIQRSCGGMIVDSIDGSWPLVGHDQLIAMTFTDDDIVPQTPVKYQEHRSMADLVNSISGNYPEREELWSMIGYDAQVSASHIAIDRRTRDLNMDFPQVPSKRQATQLASIYLRENRFEAVATVTLRPRFQVLEPGDWVVWASEMYGTKTYLVTNTNLVSLENDMPRCVQLSLQERDGSIYDPAISTPIIVPTPPGEPNYLNEVQDFTVVPVQIAGADGRLLPGIRAAWSSISPIDQTVTSVVIQYYPTNDPGSVFYRTIPVDTTVAILSEGVLGNTEYTVKTRLLTDPPRTTVWSAGETVLTDDIASDDVGLGDLQDDLKDYLNWTGGGVREIERRLEELELQIADQDYGNSYDRKQIRDQLSATYSYSKAEWKFAVDVVANGTTALAQRVEQLDAEVFDPDTGLPSVAAAVDVLSAYAGPEGALAEALTALNAASTDGEISEANFRMQAVSGPTGYSRIGAQTRQGGTGDWRGAAWFLDTPNNPLLPTRFVVDAQQMVFGDMSSGSLINPLIYDSGVWRMNVANIGTVTAGLLQSPNGKFVINLTSGFISITV